MGLKHWILPNNQFKTHLFFFNFWVGGTLFSLDLGPKGGSNFKALWRSHLTSVRGPISYRIRFMAHRSFFFSFFIFFPTKQDGSRLRTISGQVFSNSILVVIQFQARCKQVLTLIDPGGGGRTHIEKNTDLIRTYFWFKYRPNTDPI